MKKAAVDMMAEKLKSRVLEGSVRRLDDSAYLIELSENKYQYKNDLYDFSSNDYLGFSRCLSLKKKISDELEKHPLALLGATGSRLLSGNSVFAEELEKEIAVYHQVDNGLLFNSGYAANTALFSSLPQKGDTVICDEYIHASVIDGVRLSFAQRLKFRHNDVNDLEKKLKLSTGVCYVAVESVYSMDGDLADLKTIAALCRKYGAQLIVDEAHAFGVLGTGLVDTLGIDVFARVVTFGKALGLHGAIVLGADLLRDYLINFARPFIYSTAPTFSHLLAIQTAYKHLLANSGLQDRLQDKSSLLRASLPLKEHLATNGLASAIHCLFVNGNEQALNLSYQLRERGFDVRAIRSPTVPKGKERLRICLHIHNSDQEILDLCDHLHQLSYAK